MTYVPKCPSGSPSSSYLAESSQSCVCDPPLERRNSGVIWRRRLVLLDMIAQISRLLPFRRFISHLLMPTMRLLNLHLVILPTMQMRIQGMKTASFSVQFWLLTSHSVSLLSGARDNTFTGGNFYTVGGNMIIQQGTGKLKIVFNEPNNEINPLRPPWNYGHGCRCCMSFSTSGVLSSSESLTVGYSCANEREEAARDDGPLTTITGTHHVDGVLICNRCNIPIPPDSHGHGTFIRSTFLH